MQTFTVIDAATRKRRVIAVAAAVLSLHVATAAAAQEDAAEPDSPWRRLSEQTLSPTTTLTADERLMAPGETVGSHRHPGAVFVYVLEGEVRSQINDEPVVLFQTGESWFEAQGAVHTLVENASDSDPARLLIVQVGPPTTPPPTDSDE